VCHQVPLLHEKGGCCGGLRTKGHSKKTDEARPLISVVTVVFNGEAHLEQTIRSVLNQGYGNVEYIIVDGGSTDRTVDIIKRYEDRIDYWISEKDQGIYDAMNKGIRLSTGRWVNFMNAGDTFVRDDVLERIDWKALREHALIYGGKIFKKKQYTPYDVTLLRFGEIMACHQSMFFNRHVLQDVLMYDTALPIYSDYELVNRIYLMGYKMREIDLAVADYAEGGISDAVSSQKRRDKYKTLYKYYGAAGVLRGILFRLSKRLRQKLMKRQVRV